MAAPQGREGLLKGVTVTVTAVWVLSVLVQFIDPSRQVPQSVNIIMGMVVSALLGAIAVTAGKNGGNGS